MKNIHKPFFFFIDLLIGFFIILLLIAAMIHWETSNEVWYNYDRESKVFENISYHELYSSFEDYGSADFGNFLFKKKMVNPKEEIIRFCCYFLGNELQKPSLSESNFSFFEAKNKITTYGAEYDENDRIARVFFKKSKSGVLELEKIIFYNRWWWDTEIIDSQKLKNLFDENCNEIFKTQ